MQYLLAAAPILVVLALMVYGRWGGQRAGPVGWVAALGVAALAFGLTPEVLWVSQAKGVLLALYVLAVLWPALLLYNIIRHIGGVDALAQALRLTIHDRGVLLLTVAWAFSGALEGLAGFGVPIAVVSPMLVALGVAPVPAVAAVAVGHAWAVTFGDMGVIFQSLVAVAGMDAAELAWPAALMLGAACVLCGLITAHILKQAVGGLNLRRSTVIVVGVLMAFVQAVLASVGLTPLAALGAGLAGVVGGIVLGQNRLRQVKGSSDTQPTPTRAQISSAWPTLAAYGSLALLMTVLIGVPPVKAALDEVLWRAAFPEVGTLNGHVTPAGFGPAFRLFTHPGASILLVALISALVYRRLGLMGAGGWVDVARATGRAAVPASVGILSMVGLSALMEHAGMTWLLAQGLSALMERAFPLVSPFVGMLGAFATGSNINSNVLFGPMQKTIAQVLGVAPALLLAAQTAGGSLGSMLAPAKLIVGCSTVGLAGRDGEVLRITFPYGILIALTLGLFVWLFSVLSRTV
ncbi:MAG: L-lactate permease [Anaerolineae bacterium]|nr:L-lactate permease [Thermoflexales bacterium]MDW8407187.1 L-lactate permease [Anaerolineae bacterium]